MATIDRRTPLTPEHAEARKTAHDFVVGLLSIANDEADGHFRSGNRVQWHAMCLVAKELQAARDQLK